MMNSKQQQELDKYLKSLLGDNCQFGYHAQGAQLRTSVSTLGREVVTTARAESNSKPSLETN